MGDKWDRKTGFCCSTCAFYAPKTLEIGRCRKKAPTMNGYPVVYAEHDWCGDHKLDTNPSKERFTEQQNKEALKPEYNI